MVTLKRYKAAGLFLAFLLVGEAAFELSVSANPRPNSQGSVPGCKNTGPQAHNPHCGGGAPNVVQAPNPYETPQPLVQSNQLPGPTLTPTPLVVPPIDVPMPDKLHKQAKGRDGLKKGPFVDPQLPGPDGQLPPPGGKPGKKGKPDDGRKQIVTAPDNNSVQRPRPHKKPEKPSKFKGPILVGEKIETSQKQAHVTKLSGRQPVHQPAYFADNSTGATWRCAASGHQKRKHVTEDGEVTHDGAHLASMMSDVVLADVPAWHEMTPDCLITIKERRKDAED